MWSTCNVHVRVHVRTCNCTCRKLIVEIYICMLICKVVEKLNAGHFLLNLLGPSSAMNFSLAGHIWPAGHGLRTTALLHFHVHMYSKTIETEKEIEKRIWSKHCASDITCKFMSYFKSFCILLLRIQFSIRGYMYFIFYQLFCMRRYMHCIEFWPNSFLRIQCISLFCRSFYIFIG